MPTAHDAYSLYSDAHRYAIAASEAARYARNAAAANRADLDAQRAADAYTAHARAADHAALKLHIKFYRLLVNRPAVDGDCAPQCDPECAHHVPECRV